MTLFALLMLSTPAQALSYDEALRLAEQNNPDLQVAAAQRDAAKGGLLAAQSSWDPMLNAGVNRPVSTDQNFANGFTYKLSSSTVAWNIGLGQNLPTGTSWDLAVSGAETSIDDLEIFGATVEGFNNLRMSSNLSVSQQLLKGWRMSYNMRSVISAESNLSQAEASLLQERQTTLANVATLYWDLYAAGATLTVSEEAVRVAKEEQRIVQALLDVGKVAPVERTRVDAALAQAEINLIDAESAYELASDQLALTLGLPLGMPISADTEPSDAPDGVRVPVEEAIEAAMAANPGLHVARITAENAERAYQNARHGLLPTLSVSASYGLQSFKDSSQGDEVTYAASVKDIAARELPSQSVGLNLSMPLANRAARGDVMSQSAALSQAKINLETAERNIAQQVTMNIRTVESAARKVDLAALNLQLAEETLAAEKAKQEAGRAIEKDVLTAISSRDQAAVNLARTKADYQKAVVALEALQGKL